MKVGERVKWLLKQLIDIILGHSICVEIMTDYCSINVYNHNDMILCNLSGYPTL